jgi:phosphatidylglycerophosphatase A
MSSTSGAVAVLDPSRPDHWLAYGLGAGLSPMAPGTVGTLVAIPIFLLLAQLPAEGYVFAVLVLIAAAIWACGRVARELGSDDPPAIVGDEVVGFLVAMSAVATTAVPLTIGWLIMGFVLFRLFDVFKPWPVSLVQNRLRGGLGIVADDLVAGAMAWFVLKVMAMIVAASLGHGDVAAAAGHAAH